MEVKCQDCGSTIEPNQSSNQIPKEIYLDKSKNIAIEISEKFKTGWDITQSILRAENEPTKRRKDKIEELLLKGESTDYSLWDSCYNSIMKTFETASTALEQERDRYLEGLKQLESEIAKKSEKDEINSIDPAILQQLKEETGISDKNILQKIPASQLDTIKELLGELKKLEDEEKELDEDAKILEEQEKEFDEQKYWDNENELECKIKAHQEEMAQRVNQWKNINKHYNYLKKLNVLNDLFKIEIDGEYGTISGFRLGPVSSRDITIKADEINAAMGQCVLLLSTIAIKAEFQFSRIELVPMGGNSKVIHTKENNKKYTYIFNFYAKTSFNLAMTVFLKAMNLIIYFYSKKFEHLKNKSKINSFVPMDNEKFGDEKIKITAENLEEWKYMLQNLKWLIYMSQIEDRIKQEAAKST